MKRVSNDPDKHIQVAELRQKIFEENLEYMIGCELRAFSQHASIVASTIHRRTVRELNSQEVKINSSASISKQKLASEVKSSKLSRMPNEIDLQHCIDGYVDGISKVHTLNIQLLKDVIEKLMLYFNTFAAYCINQIGIKFQDTYLIMLDKKANNTDQLGEYVSHQIIFDSEWLDLILLLRDKQRRPTIFSRASYTP